MDIKNKPDVTSPSDRSMPSDDDPSPGDDLLGTEGPLALAAEPAPESADDPPVTREQRRSRRKREIAERGGTTLEEVGAIMNLTRERRRQVEVKALAKLDALKDMMALRDYVEEGPVGKRRLHLLSKKDLNDDDPPAAADDEDDD